MNSNINDVRYFQRDVFGVDEVPASVRFGAYLIRSGFVEIGDETEQCLESLR